MQVSTDWVHQDDVNLEGCSRFKIQDPRRQDISKTFKIQDSRLLPQCAAACCVLCAVCYIPGYDPVGDSDRGQGQPKTRRVKFAGS